MNDQKSQNEDQLAALQNELLVVRSELLNIQTARSVRAAQFVKQLLKANPNELHGILRTLPSVFRRTDPPRLEKLTNSSKLFNSINNPLPLFQFPNINIAVIGEEIKNLFQFSCNTTTLGDEMYKTILAYDAIQIAAVDVREYNSDKHDKLLEEAASKGAKIIHFYEDRNEEAKFIKKFGEKSTGFNLNPSNPNSIRNFIDIYEINTYTSKIDGLDNLYVSDSLADFKYGEIAFNLLGGSLPATIKPGSIVIIDDSDLLILGESPRESIANITNMIASGVPTVIKGKRPKWITDDVVSFDNEKDINRFIDTLRKPYAVERYAVTCRRSTILQLNATQSVGEILKVINQIDKMPQPTISILLATMRPQYIKKALEQIEAQTIKPHEVIIMLHGMSESDSQKAAETIKKSGLNIKSFQFDRSELFGQVLNHGLDRATGEFTTKMDDDDYYSPSHLSDLYAAHLHSRADIVGKWNNWVYLKADDKVVNWIPEVAESYVRHLPGGTLFARTSILKSVRFGYVKRAIDSELYRRAISRGATLYSTHRYNYIRVRDGGHTYKTTDADFKSRSHPIEMQGLPMDQVSA